MIKTKICPNKKCGAFYSENSLPTKWLSEYKFCPFCGNMLKEDTLDVEKR